MSRYYVPSRRACPICGSRCYITYTHLVRSTSRKIGAVPMQESYRRRNVACAKCDFKTVTYEIDKADLQRWRDTEDRMKKFKIKSDKLINMLTAEVESLKEIIENQEIKDDKRLRPRYDYKSQSQDVQPPEDRQGEI